MTNERGGRFATGLHVVVLAGVLLMLLCASAQANWLARGSAVLGVGYSLKKNLGEGVDLLGEALDAAVRGDVQRVQEIGSEIEALPGRLVRDAFPVFKLGAGVRDAAGAAEEKLKALQEGLPRLGAGALSASGSSRKTLPSAELAVRRYYGDDDDKAPGPRAALAIDEEERDWYQTHTNLLDPPPLAAHAVPVASDKEEPEAPEPAGWDAEASPEEEAQGTGALVQGVDPWGPEESDADTSPWDDDAADATVELAQAEEMDDPEEAAIESGDDDYASALNTLLGGNDTDAPRDAPDDGDIDQRKRVQTALAAQGLDPGPADGLFGQQTRKAIAQWQQDHGLEPTGWLTEEQAGTLLTTQSELASQVGVREKPLAQTSDCAGNLTTGKLTFDNSDDEYRNFMIEYTYEGQLCDRNLHGTGKLRGRFPERPNYWTTYEGEWRDGKPHGRGVRNSYVNGNFRSEGEWRNGELWNGKFDRWTNAVDNIMECVRDGEVICVEGRGYRGCPTGC